MEMIKYLVYLYVWNKGFFFFYWFFYILHYHSTWKIKTRLKEIIRNAFDFKNGK